MEPIALNATEIKHFDELTADKEGLDRALNIAMTFYTNSMNRCMKEERELWQRLKEKYNLPDKTHFKIVHMNGAVYVVEGDLDD